MDLGLWLLHAERRCSRVGNLKARLDRDRERVISIMNQWKLARDEMPAVFEDQILLGVTTQVLHLHHSVRKVFSQTFLVNLVSDPLGSRFSQLMVF